MKKQEEEMRYQAVDLVVVSDQIIVGENHRKTDEGKEMMELVESVRVNGILNPLSVRKVEGGYELLAGHRRLHAALKVGLTNIPVRCFSTTDEESKVIAATENVHRRALNPIEEARAIKELVTRYLSYEAAASMVGKSPAHVERMVRLLDLGEEVIRAIETEKLSAAHGFQLLRMDEKKRGEIAKNLLKNIEEGYVTSVEQLKMTIEDKASRRLDNAFFPKDKDFAELPPCTGCPLNSANQGALFPDAESGICTGPKCYDQKQRLAYEQFQEMSAKLPKYEGMKALGIVSPPTGYPPRIAGLRVVQQDEMKELKKLFDERREAFAWGVTKPSRYDSEPKVFLAYADDSLLPKRHRHVSAPETDWEMLSFVKNRVGRALLLAAAAEFDPGKVKKGKVADLVLRVIEPHQPDDIGLILASTIGVDAMEKAKMTSRSKFEKFIRAMSLPELLHVLWAESFLSKVHNPDNFKGIVKDIDGIIKRVSTEAKKEWEEKKKKVDEEKKKG